MLLRVMMKKVHFDTNYEIFQGFIEYKKICFLRRYLPRIDKKIVLYFISLYITLKTFNQI